VAVRQVDVTSIQPFAGGTSFGDTGAYELVRARAHIALDPSQSANARIVDLQFAQHDASGFVPVLADLVVLRPVDRSRGNGGLLYSVANRGSIVIPFTIGDQAIHDAASSPQRVGPDMPFGDGFPLRHGWTLAWSGWQFDLPRSDNQMTVDVPQAIVGGAPIRGQVSVRITVSEPAYSQHLTGWTPPAGPCGPPASPYPAAEPLEQPAAVMTVRDSLRGKPQLIDRHRWRFARDVDGLLVPDGSSVWLRDGFEPGRVYEVAYTTDYSPVVGCGLAAVRDVVAFVRKQEESSHVVGYGLSQAGRFLRQFIFDGLNLDEDGDQVFDGILCHYAGARRGEFNHRYALPSEPFAPGFASQPPFALDSVTGGLLDRQRELGGVPKVMAVSSSWEYWRGDAALGHIDPQAGRDIPEPGGCRTYLLASSDHIGDFPELSATLDLANPPNGLDPTPVLRALLVALSRWVTEGVEPPASRIPRIEDGSAALRGDVLLALGGLPGLSQPDASGLPEVAPADLGPDAMRGIGAYPVCLGEPFPCYVSQVDADGNEVGGIRLPENAVPVATRTGWNPTPSVPARTPQLANFAGSRSPFPKIPTAGDPRLAIDARYRNRQHYVNLAQSVAEDLVRERFMLPEDVPYAAGRAIAGYDAIEIPQA
jgi:hypothetical protein